MRSWVFWLVVGVAPAMAQPVAMPKPNYCFGLLNAVPNRPTLPAEEAQRIQKEHMAHMTALGEKRWLLGAGPVATPGGLRGILISACKSVAEANELASADPAVKQGRLFVESYSWTGPPGIGDGYWKERAANPEAKTRMLKHALVFLRKSAERKETPGGVSTSKDGPAREVMEAHFAYVGSLKKSGLVAAGPFHDAGDRIGVFIFEGVAAEEGKRLVEQDPLVKGGHARAEAFEVLVADGVFPKP